MSARAGRHPVSAAEISAGVAPDPISDVLVVDLTTPVRPSFKGGSASALTRLVAHLVLRVWIFLLLPEPSQRAIVMWSPGPMGLAIASAVTDPTNPTATATGRDSEALPQTPSQGENGGGGSGHGARSRRERARGLRNEGAVPALSRDKRPAHHVTTFAYDALNRPTLVKDPPPFGY